MRIEVAGANVTESVADILETLQTDPEAVNEIREAVVRVTHRILVGESAGEYAEDLSALHRLIDMIETLAAPPEADDPANDTPTASF